MNPHATPYQPRYLEYCRYNGRLPEDQLIHDKQQYPGGCMCGFILWSTQARSYCESKLRKLPEVYIENILGLFVDEEKYTVWLQEQVTSALAGLPNPWT